jgi:hypothetical protein
MASACSVDVRISPSRGRGGGGFRRGGCGRTDFGDVPVADVLRAAVMAARMVARLTGSLPVRPLMCTVFEVRVSSRPCHFLARSAADRYQG